MSCGAPLTRECPACGAQVEPEWRFCAGCGGALEEAAPTQSSSPRSYTPAHLAERILGSRSLLEGERKRVTILFADLKGSTELISNLDPEDARGLLDPPLESMMDAVHRFEGTVNRVQGDGLMAMFGAPLAHEDHALRACHAAIEMRRAIGDMAPESAVPIELRVGLHSGEVVVRAIHNDLSMSYDAVGLAAHLAARMEQIAAPGEIRMTAQTLRAVEGFVEATALGTTEIKGLTQPMETYALRSTTTARTRVEATEPRGLTPFVGRRRDLEALQAAFESAGRGEGRAVFVSGEPGIGKSRLMLEFRRQVADSATWLEGHSLSFGQAMPLYPVIDLLRGNFGIDEDDDELGVIEKIRGGISRVGKDLEPLIPHFRHLMNVDPGDALVTGMDPQLRRAELFDALRRLLLGASAIRPQVILFEDLHWVDPATEALLEFIANSIPTARILCVFTYRPGYRHPFGERTFHVHLSLSSLSGSDAASMAEGMLQAHHLTDGLQQLLLDKVEGNPFYLEEVVKSLRESGAIEHRSGGFVLTRPLDQIDVPDTIQGVIMARIDRLAEAPRTTLQLASVIGREFTERLLKRIRDFDDPANVVLEELKAIELVYEKTLFPELAYMFKHALTQDVAYGSLLSERRRELHGTIGRAIEELYRERLAEHYEMLAYHYERAEEWARAAQWFHRAAAKAAGSFANREALTLYERAIAAMRLLGEAADKTELAELNKSLAWVQFAQNEMQGSIDSGREAARLAAECGDAKREGAARAELAMVRLHGLHDFDGSCDEAERALALGERAGATNVIANTRYVRGMARGVTARLEECVEDLHSAVRLAEEGGHPRVAAQALAFLSFNKNWQGELELADRLGARALAAAREHRLILTLLSGLWMHAIPLIGLGRYDEARQSLEEQLDLAERVGDVIWRNRVVNTMGWLYMECGNLDRAREFNERGALLGKQQGFFECEANAQLNLADTAIIQGDLTEAGERLDFVYRGATNPKTSEWMKWRYSMHLFASMGEHALAKGDVSRASGFANECLGIAEPTSARKYLARGRRLAGDIALTKGHQEDALEAHRKATVIAQSVGNPTQLWRTRLSLAKVFDRLGDRDAARRECRAAEEVLARSAAAIQDPDLRACHESSNVFAELRERAAAFGT